MSIKKALITGITGQDGSYLAEFLLSKGYEIHGIIRRSSSFNTGRIDHLYVDPHYKNTKLFLHYGDLSDPGLITEIIYRVKPNEIYNLGAQSHVRTSFDMPEYTGNITALGTTRLLEAIRRSQIKTKFYQASSSELFGSSLPPQNEETPFCPSSPYAVAKLYSYWMVDNYRKSYGLYACNGILFNHESPRRGETFLTRKVTRAIASMLAGTQKKLFIGNLDARRDWGFAPEYVEMMWLMLQQKEPEDFVIGTGNSHSVREFLEQAYSYSGLEIRWVGKGKSEKGIIANIKGNWTRMFNKGDVLIEVDARYFRPVEVDHLCSDISRANTKLGWRPRIKFDDLVKIMVDSDLKALGLELPGKGLALISEKGFDYISPIVKENQISS